MGLTSLPGAALTLPCSQTLACVKGKESHLPGEQPGKRDLNQGPKVMFISHAWVSSADHGREG